MNTTFIHPVAAMSAVARLITPFRIKLFLVACSALMACAASTRANELFYTGGAWHIDSLTGVIKPAPADTDAMHIIDGSFDIPAGLAVTSTLSGTTILSAQTGAGVKIGAAGSIGGLVDTSGTVNVAGLWDNKSHLLIGGLGTGVLNINSGTVRVSGNTYIGRATGASGTLTINSGLMQTNGWVHVGGAAVGDCADLGGANAGDGSLYIGQSGTLVIGASGMRIAYGNVATTADVTVDGVLDNTGYIQIGQWGKGTLTVGQTGTVRASTYINIGGGDGPSNSSGSAYIDGRVIAGTTIYVGSNRTTGILTIGEHGWVTGTGNLAIGYTANATGTATVKSGGLWDSNAIFSGIGYLGQGVLKIEQSGTVITRRTSGNTYVGGTIGSSGTILVDGYMQTANRYHIGNNGGSGYLEIGSSGTVITAIMCIAYSAAGIPVAASYATSGTVILHSNSYLETMYLQVGQWGQGYLDIAQSATVRCKDYFYSGGGDDGRPGYTAYGYTRVAGRLEILNSAGVGNQNDSIGVLDITETGAVRIGTAFYIARNAGDATHAAATGTTTVAGLLTAASASISDGGGKGTLNILGTGSVAFSGNYTQRAAAVLGIVIDPARTTPYLEIGGNASLAGTLNISGYAGAITGEITKSSQIPTQTSFIIRTSGSYIGDFATINLEGGGELPGFVTFSGFVTGTKIGDINYSDYRVGYALAGTIDLAEGKTFEIDTPFADQASTAKWDGKSIIKSGDGTLIISSTSVRHTGATLVNGGALKITSPTAVTALRGDLVNHSIIDLTSPAGTGTRTLRAARLFGTGTFLMAVNTATGASDSLELVGDASRLIPATIAGSHKFVLSDIRTDGKTATKTELAALILARLSGSAAINNATLTADLDWDDGAVIYPVNFSAEGIGTLGDAAPSLTSNAAAAITAAQNLMWAGQQDNLARQFADLRVQPARTGLWVRTYGGSATVDPIDADDVDLDLYGLTVGADFAWKAFNGNLHAGAFVGYGYATQKFVADAEGDSTLYAGGLYAAWLNNAGWFLNTTLGFASYQNKFTATDGDGATDGDHDDTGLALSLEFGRRLAFAKGWFAEPSAQFAYTRLDQSDYTTTGAHDLSVRATAANIFRARVSSLFGRTFTYSDASTLQIHARLGALYEGSSGGKITVGTLPMHPNLDGARAELGLGLLWCPNAANQVYINYDAAVGENYEQPWLLSLGFRYAF